METKTIEKSKKIKINIRFFLINCSILIFFSKVQNTLVFESICSNEQFIIGDILTKFNNMDKSILYIFVC